LAPDVKLHSPTAICRPTYPAINHPPTERDRQADWDARFDLLNRLRRSKALSRRMMAVPNVGS